MAQSGHLRGAIILTTIVMFLLLGEFTSLLRRLLPKFLRYSLRSYGNVTIFITPFFQPKGLISLVSSVPCTMPLLEHLPYIIVYLSSSMSLWLDSESLSLIHFCSPWGLTIKDCGEEKWMWYFNEWRPQVEAEARQEIHRASVLSTT